VKQRDRQGRSDSESDASVACEFIAFDDELGDEMQDRMKAKEKQ
jgi:hypothetical protein